MTKYYKVIKDTFLWIEGAILVKRKMNNSSEGYEPIENTTLWNKTEFNGEEYISARIVENCPEYFVEVYPVNLLTRTVYKIKEEARSLMEKTYNE